MTAAWLIVDAGKKGSENQCIGLAEALTISYTLKHVTIKKPWCWLPRIKWPRPERCAEQGATLFAEPLPDLIIASGRSSAPVAAWFKKYHGIKTIYLLHPQMNPAKFDWIIAPRHDQLTAPNVISTTGGLHQITLSKLKEEGKKFAHHWEELPRPWVTVLIGGSNKYFSLTDTILKTLAQQLQKLYQDRKISFLVTFSRRTDLHQRHFFQSLIKNIPHWIWDECSPNPYIALLDQADFICCTADSVTMVTEACMTGKPIYIIPLKGSSKKFSRFYATLQKQGHAHFFEGQLDPFRAVPLREISTVAAFLKENLSI